jgi:hypothetical protein
LEGLLEADEYHNKKAELIENKMALKQKIAQISQKGNHWLEPYFERQKIRFCAQNRLASARRARASYLKS